MCLYWIFKYVNKNMMMMMMMISRLLYLPISTSSHWSLRVSMSVWMDCMSGPGVFSISLCRSSTVLMRRSMDSCLSLSSA